MIKGAATSTGNVRQHEMLAVKENILCDCAGPLKLERQRQGKAWGMLLAARFC